MRILLSFITLLAFAFSSSGQVKDSLFPAMQVSTADNVVVNLPDDVKGKYTLLVLTHSKKAGKKLQGWFEPVFSKFIHKATGLLESFGYDINVYFVPMFIGLNAAAIKSAKSQTLKKIDTRLLPHILFYKGELKKYKEKLKFEQDNIPYIFVLNPEGMIVETVSGGYKEEKMNQIETVIE